MPNHILSCLLTIIQVENVKTCILIEDSDLKSSGVSPPVPF